MRNCELLLLCGPEGRGRSRYAGVNSVGVGMGTGGVGGVERNPGKEVNRGRM